MGNMFANVQLQTSQLTSLSRMNILHEVGENNGIVEGEYVAIQQNLVTLVVELPTTSQQCYIESSSIGDPFLYP
jgi:hypothetical protein